MKRKRLAGLVIGVFITAQISVAYATSTLNISISDYGYHDQIYYDQGVEVTTYDKSLTVGVVDNSGYSSVTNANASYVEADVLNASMSAEDISASDWYFSGFTSEIDLITTGNDQFSTATLAYTHNNYIVPQDTGRPYEAYIPFVTENYFDALLVPSLNTMATINIYGDFFVKNESEYNGDKELWATILYNNNSLTITSDDTFDIDYRLLSNGSYEINGWYRGWQNTTPLSYDNTYQFIHNYSISTTLIEVTPVPEPATSLLFGIGWVGLASLRLRRKKTSMSLS